MAEQRLPIVDGDDGTWGAILNQYLEKEHYNTGTDNAANGGHKNVTLRPGTTSAGTAPLKFTTGDLLSTTEAGTVEFNSGKFYMTSTDSGARKTVAIYDDSSGATGDIYYRDASGNFVRLAIGGTSGSVLNVSGGLPAWGPATATASTASTIALRDSNGNLTINNSLDGYTTTATAAGTTTLTNSSTYMQYFTGSTTQTVLMPVASTCALGQKWMIVNNSTGLDSAGLVTIQTSAGAGNTILVLPAGSYAEVTCILASGTTVASWSFAINPSRLTVSKTDPNTIRTPTYGDVWIDMN